jgi:1,2-diacylglycerol 3-alpha-glucosyltransferase
MMKVALVSTGLGRVLRGFESFTESLFTALRRYAPDVDVTLFQGGRSGKAECVWVPNFHRYDVPAQWLGYEKGNLLEKRSFALSLYPTLRLGKYDIVHYNDLVMGSALFHLRQHLGGRFKLLYCNGAPSPPIHYHHRCDFAQLLTRPMYEEAKAFGLADNKLFLLTYGVDSERFSPAARAQRQATRSELGIAEKAKVVLTVSALKREHKRVDYIMREISSLTEGVWFVAAGQRTEDTAFLETEAEQLLPDRFRFLSWPSERVQCLYGTADIFVLGSLTEAFGLVTVEAMLSGLPVIIHNGPVFRWLAEGSAVQCINMAGEGELSRALTAMELTITSSRDQAEKRFSWQCLVPHYLQMYRDVIGQN